MEIEFSWDEHKAEINLKKHGVAFEDATLVFYDAHALYKQDRFENGEYRWQAIGMVHGQAVLCPESQCRYRRLHDNPARCLGEGERP